MNLVVVGQTTVAIEINKAQLLASLLGEQSRGLEHFSAEGFSILRIVGDFQILRRGAELRMVSPDNGACFNEARIPSLIKAIARARDWYERIVAGEIRTIGQLTQQSGLTERYVKRILQCAYLSPKITEAVLAGTHRPNLTLKEILRGVPLNWREQEKLIEIFSRQKGNPIKAVDDLNTYSDHHQSSRLFFGRWNTLKGLKSISDAIVRPT